MAAMLLFSDDRQVQFAVRHLPRQHGHGAKNVLDVLAPVDIANHQDMETFGVGGLPRFAGAAEPVHVMAVEDDGILLVGLREERFEIVSRRL